MHQFFLILTVFAAWRFLNLFVRPVSRDISSTPNDSQQEDISLIQQGLQEVFSQINLAPNNLYHHYEELLALLLKLQKACHIVSSPFASGAIYPKLVLRGLRVLLENLELEDVKFLGPDSDPLLLKQILDEILDLRKRLAPKVDTSVNLTLKTAPFVETNFNSSFWDSSQQLFEALLVNIGDCKGSTHTAMLNLGGLPFTKPQINDAEFKLLLPSCPTPGSWQETHCRVLFESPSEMDVSTDWPHSYICEAASKYCGPILNIRMHEGQYEESYFGYPDVHNKVPPYGDAVPSMAVSRLIELNFLNCLNPFSPLKENLQQWGGVPADMHSMPIELKFPASYNNENRQIGTITRSSDESDTNVIVDRPLGNLPVKGLEVQDYNSRVYPVSFRKLAETYDAFFQAGEDEEPVRVAILDTGIDLGHPELQAARSDPRSGRPIKGEGPQINRVKKWKSFCGGKEEEVSDIDGHGTHVAGIILQLAPTAELYIAQVSKDRSSNFSRKEMRPKVSTLENGRNMSEHNAVERAIEWAIECKVHLINMSCGFKDCDERVLKALEKAKRSGIVVFAAASNKGSHEDVSWPARDGEVAICVHSSNDYGNRKSDFTPDAARNNINFMVVGEQVCSLWTTHRGGGLKAMDGTSSATPVATAIAALLLAFTRQDTFRMRDVRLHIEDDLACFLWRGLPTDAFSKDTLAFEQQHLYLLETPPKYPQRQAIGKTSGSYHTMAQSSGDYLGAVKWRVAPHPRAAGKCITLGSILTNPEDPDSLLNGDDMKAIDKKDIIIEHNVNRTLKRQASRDASLLFKILQPLLSTGLGAEVVHKHDLETMVEAMDIQEQFIRTDWKTTGDYIRDRLKAASVQEYLQSCYFQKKLYMITGVATAKRLSIKQVRTGQGSLGAKLPAFQLVGIDVGAQARFGHTLDSLSKVTIEEPRDFAYRVRQFTYRKFRTKKIKDGSEKSALAFYDTAGDEYDSDEYESLALFKGFEEDDVDRVDGGLLVFEV
uniref:Putative subtilisin n=1 Tax=Onygena corvina TaxID=180788 RepID=A0A0B4VM11_9EURO|nr:putative subtilisin [Onygena corvina]